MRHTVHEQTCELPADHATVVVVADTHGRPHPDLLDRVAAHRPALVLHAGDLGRGDLLDRLGELAPVVAVRGNIDNRDTRLPDSVDLTLERPTHPRLRLLLTHIAIARLHLTRNVRARAQSLDARLVVFGHSHQPFLGREGRFALFNPGSAGPRRFRLPITYGVLTLSERGLDFGHMDLETGSPWKPG